MKSIFMLFIVFVALSVPGCPTIPTTENPANPKADDPLVLGEEVMPPMGCIGWEVREGKENADC